MMDFCPRCSNLIRRGNVTGESAIYGSHDIPDLCEQCFLDEEVEIETAGTNDLPETLEWYRRNLKALRYPFGQGPSRPHSKEHGER